MIFFFRLILPILISRFFFTRYRFYYKGLVSSKKLLSESAIPIEQLYRPQFRRSIYTVGLIMRYFDFKQPDVYGGAEDAQGRRLASNLHRQLVLSKYSSFFL